jgi:DNA-binding MarR family transcriptional regulator
MPTEDDVPGDIRQIRNDLDRVRQDIDSINRVQVISNSGAILKDISSIVRKSRQMVAALFLTKNSLSSGDLAKELHIDQSNLDKVVKDLVEGGLLYREKIGKSVYYKRATRLELIGFEKQREFIDTYESWKKSLDKEA